MLPDAAKTYREWQRAVVDRAKTETDAEFKDRFRRSATHKGRTGATVDQLDSAAVVDVLRRKAVLTAQNPIVIDYIMPLKDGRSLEVAAGKPIAVRKRRGNKKATFRECCTSILTQ